MKANRKAGTRPERELRSDIHRLGLRFRVNRRPEAAIKVVADIVFPSTKVAVFVDGCYWHGCEDHGTRPRTNAEYWTAKIERNRARDLFQGELLSRAGWTVVRVWEHEASAEGAKRIARTVMSRRP
jgi:DNA mismatch endonuclease (patch repair protein)